MEVGIRLTMTRVLFQDMENKIRSTLNEIYFGKTKDIVNGLRYYCLTFLQNRITFSFYRTSTQQLCSPTQLVKRSRHLIGLSLPFLLTVSPSYLLFLFNANVFFPVASLFSLLFPCPLHNLFHKSFHFLFFSHHISVAILIHVLILLSPLLPCCLSSALQIY